ncbi:DUF5959 family protein [Streptomyces antibioticus]|uniref:DUF5959 family protein n=1 Tax=Streptomyces antibioticus TaxID=1890 RepID=UPI0036B280E0
MARPGPVRARGAEAGRGCRPGRCVREDRQRSGPSSVQAATVVDGVQTFELFRFADAVQSVVLKSGFVNGRVGLQISTEDLDEWERCLEALQSDEAAQWPARGRSAWGDVTPDDPVEVTVHDSPSTQIAVRVPIDVTPEWLEENRLRLDRVRAAVSASSWRVLRQIADGPESITGPVGIDVTAVCDDAPVSQDLAVWAGERPFDNRAAGSTHDELYERYLDRTMPSCLRCRASWRTWRPSSRAARTTTAASCGPHRRRHRARWCTCSCLTTRRRKCPSTPRSWPANMVSSASTRGGECLRPWA